MKLRERIAIGRSISTLNIFNYLSHKTKVETWGIGTEVHCKPVAIASAQMKSGDADKILANGTSSHHELTSKEFVNLTLENGDYCRSNVKEGVKPNIGNIIQFSNLHSNNETMLKMVDAGAYLDFYYPIDGCAGTFFASWQHYSVEMDKDFNQGLSVTATPQNDSVYIVCGASTHASRFSVIVDYLGVVLDYTPLPANSSALLLGNLSKSIPGSFWPIDEPSTNGAASAGEVLAYAFQNSIFSQTWSLESGATVQGIPHIDPRPIDWLTLLLHRMPGIEQGLRFNATASAAALEKVYMHIFSQFLTTYASQIFSKSLNEDVSVGIEFSAANFLITSTEMVLLSLFILVVCVVVVVCIYVLRPGAFLKNLPTTIAATLPSIYASKIGTDLVVARTLGKGEMERHLGRGYRKYGYGWFRGRDGAMHLGVDREPVQRVEQQPWL